MRIFGAALAVFMAWMMGVVTWRMIEVADNLNNLAQRVTVLEIEIKECKERK